MILNEIRTIIAITHGIQTDRLSKIDLIQIVQTAEGNVGCFGTAYDRICDQTHCCWRKHCFEDAS
jgi:hypothetical protein